MGSQNWQAPFFFDLSGASTSSFSLLKLPCFIATISNRLLEFMFVCVHRPISSHSPLAVRFLYILRPNHIHNP